MSLDIDRINGLLSIVKEAAQHPTQLASLGTLAMKELRDHNAEAKKEHDTFLAEQAKEAAAKKTEADLKAKKLADEELEKAELTGKPQEVKAPEPNRPVARRAVPDEVVEEEAHGA